MTEMTTVAYRESFVCWIDITGAFPVEEDWDHDYHPTCEWGWCCNLCGVRTDDRPCPDHAPLAIPGLRLVECQTDPPHILLAVDRDDYGHGCPACWANQNRDELHALKVATHRYRHGAWRRWQLSCSVLYLLRRLGIVSGLGYSTGDGCHGCINGITWRWKR